jgi:hypothetical protein
MTADNFDNALRTLQHAQPFALFTVELNNGHRFEVDSPFALVVRDGVAVYVAPGGIPVLFDQNSVNIIFAGKSDTSFKPE